MRFIDELQFPEDQAFLVDISDNLQLHFTLTFFLHFLHFTFLDQECKARSMRISIEKKKTEVMVIGREMQNLNITIYNITLKQVTEFKYLRATFAEDGTMVTQTYIRYKPSGSTTSFAFTAS